MAITNLTTLQAAIKLWLNRSDLDTAGIPEFIQLAERRLRRDHRTRKLLDRTLSVSTENVNLPSDFGSLQDLYHDTSGQRGEIEIISAAQLSVKKQLFSGATGIPRYAAILDTVFRFAPAPDTTYSLFLTYWRKIPALGGAQVDNWLLLEHPDIYLYASLVESAPFLKNDNRVGMWENELNKRLEELHADQTRRHWSGKMTRRPKRSL